MGHYVGSLKGGCGCQNSGQYDGSMLMIADAQALTDNAENPEKVRQEHFAGWRWITWPRGIEPAKSHIFIQSMVPELTELSFYYMNLVTVSG